MTPEERESCLGSSSKRAEPSTEELQSFAEKWEKRSRTNRTATDAAARGAFSLGARDGMVATGGASGPLRTMNSHVDLLKPASRASGVQTGSGQSSCLEGEVPPVLGIRGSGGAVWPAWRFSQSHQPGGSLDPCTPTTGLLCRSSGRISPLMASSGGIPCVRDGKVGASISCGPQSSTRCAQAATELALSASVADDASASESGSSVLPPAVIRSLSSLPIDGLGSVSGASGRLWSHEDGNRAKEGEASRLTPAGRMEGTGVDDQGRFWTRTSDVITHQASIEPPWSGSYGFLGGSPHSHVLASPGAGSEASGTTCGKEAGGHLPGGVGGSATTRRIVVNSAPKEGMQGSGTGTNLKFQMEVDQSSDGAEDEAGEGWLENLMQDVMGGRPNGVLEATRPDLLMGDSGAASVDAGTPWSTVHGGSFAQPEVLQCSVGRHSALGSRQQEFVPNFGPTSFLEQHEEVLGVDWSTAVDGVGLHSSGDLGLFIVT